jgi:hypothetical protein
MGGRVRGRGRTFFSRFRFFFSSSRAHQCPACRKGARQAGTRAQSTIHRLPDGGQGHGLYLQRRDMGRTRRAAGQNGRGTFFAAPRRPGRSAAALRATMRLNSPSSLAYLAAKTRPSRLTRHTPTLRRYSFSGTTRRVDAGADADGGRAATGGAPPPPPPTLLPGAAADPAGPALPGPPLLADARRGGRDPRAAVPGVDAPDADARATSGRGRMGGVACVV